MWQFCFFLFLGVRIAALPAGHSDHVTHVLAGCKSTAARLPANTGGIQNHAQRASPNCWGIQTTKMLSPKSPSEFEKAAKMRSCKCWHTRVGALRDLQPPHLNSMRAKFCKELCGFVTISLLHYLNERGGWMRLGARQPSKFLKAFHGFHCCLMEISWIAMAFEYKFYRLL